MKTNFIVSVALLLTLIISNNVLSESKSGVAKIIIMRGNVKAKVDGKVVKMKKGDWLREGTILKTANKSFAKLLFIDKSSMNLGPKSQMKIETFPREKAGVITLMKGQLRSKVTKNYMNIKDKKKSKLFIKTKTAAMGVRGTDFQVNYNPANSTTSLVTFSGAVAMGKFAANMSGRNNQRRLERIVSSDQAVVVKKGQYSGVSGKGARATLPVKISPSQLNTMKNNNVPGLKTKNSTTQASPKAKKKFRSVIPPGVSAKGFANEGNHAEKAVADTVGVKVVQAVQVAVRQDAIKADLSDTPPPEGMYNASTGEIAPTAGGYVDMQTALYIPPPEGSSYDANAEVYIPPSSMGYVNPATGDFENTHYDLADDGSFTLKDGVASTASNDGSGTSRDPASVDGGLPPPPPGEVDLIPQMDGATFDDQAMAEKEAIISGPDLQQLADATLLDIEQERSDDLTAPDQNSMSSAIFSFTIQ